MSKVIETLILLRNGFYVSVIRETEDTKNELLILVRGVAFSMLQRNEEARTAFQLLISTNEYKLCGLIGWIHVNQSSANEKMKKRLKDEIKSANVQGFTNAAFYYYITEKYEKALEFSEKACRLDLGYQREETWMVYASIRFVTNAIEDALSAMERFPRRDSVYSDLVTVEFASFLGHTDAIYDNLLKKYPATENISVEKAKSLFLLDPRRDVLELFSKIPDDNLCALYLRCFIALITSADVKETIEIICRMLNVMEEEESGNHSLFLETVELFASVNEKKEVTCHLLERIKAWKIPSSRAYHFSALELELRLFLKEYDRAEEILKDDCVTDSLEIVFCSAHLNLLQGRLEEAVHLLDYIEERIHLDPPSFFLYLKAFYLMLTGKIYEGNNLLEQALRNHLSGLEFQTNLIKFYIDLDTHRLLEMISLYFEFSAKEPYEKGEIVDPLTVVAGTSGKMLAQHFPYHKLAQLYWARLCFIVGDVSSSIVTARNITENIDNQCVEAYLLEARSFLVTEDYMASKRCLENCLSYNFSVRSMPEYYFILGGIQRRQGDFSSALKTLHSAQKMMAENEESRGITKELKSNGNIFRSYDIELEICKTMSGLGQEEEAIKRLENVISNCSDVELSNYFLFSWVDIMLISENSEAAIEALQRIPDSSRYFIRSRKYLAKIALEKFSDKTTYIACFREIVTVSPVSENWILLGNAYMSLQMPDKAIEAYEQGRPSTSEISLDLIKAMGNAYLKSYQFSKALSFVHEAMQHTDDPKLKLTLIEIQYRTGQYEKALKTINDASKSLDSKLPATYDSLKTMSELEQQQIKIHVRAGSSEEVIKRSLHEAYSTQNKIIRQCGIDNLQLLGQERMILGNICSRLGSYYRNCKNYDDAIRYYKEALNLLPDNLESMKALTSIFAEKGDKDQCESMYKLLSKVDSTSAVLLAQMNFRKGEFSTVVKLLKDILDSNSRDEEALLLLFLSSRQAGTLEVAEKYLEKAGPNLKYQAQNYLKALLKRFTGQHRESIDLLISCKNDPLWEPLANKAILDNILDLSVFDGMEPRAADEETRLLYLQVTKKLKVESLEREVYTSFGQLLGGHKSEADAIFRNMDIMNNDTVPYQLLQATALLCLKQVPKAKVTLKRFSQSPWTFENGEWLEKCWLLLAQIYVNSNKGEQAKEFCQRVLKYNASSLRALELLGSIAEREHSFSEAAKSYEAVWQRSKCTNLSVGYHFANCLLKARRFTETINLCQDLMRIQPNFPRLQKDIYEKALNLIRS